MNYIVEGCDDSFRMVIAAKRFYASHNHQTFYIYKDSVTEKYCCMSEWECSKFHFHGNVWTYRWNGKRWISGEKTV